jgi:hypothetical protein
MNYRPWLRSDTQVTEDTVAVASEGAEEDLEGVAIPTTVIDLIN